MNKVLERRAVAKAVSPEERMEALEAQVAALSAEVKGRKQNFEDAAEYTAAKSKRDAAKSKGRG